METFETIISVIFIALIIWVLLRLTLLLITSLISILLVERVSEPLWFHPIYMWMVRRHVKRYANYYDNYKLTVEKSPYRYVLIWQIGWLYSSSKNFNNQHVRIGCEQKTIEGWDYFFSSESTQWFDNERGSLDFKRIKYQYKQARKEIMKKYKNVKD